MTVAAWRGSIGCEGGPVIVAELDKFARWTGGEPLPNEDRRALHLWGRFTPDLPEKFRPDGPTGHQFIPALDFDSLERLRTELFEHLQQRWPGTTVVEQFGAWKARRPDGAQLNLDYWPSSEYDRCITDLQELKLHAFDGDAQGVVWSAEPGIVEVVRLASGELLLMQVECAEDDEHAEALVRAAAADSASGRHAPRWDFATTQPTLAVVWAPNSASDASPADLQPREAAEPGVVIDLATGGSGAIVAVPPGDFHIACGRYVEDDGGVSWRYFARSRPLQ